MDFLLPYLDWIWQAITDDNITAAIKPRMIFFGGLLAVVGWWVKRTPSTEDDELLNNLRRVIPMLKKR
jgi:hypothetical protein